MYRYFFGCWNKPGHSLWNLHGGCIHDRRFDQFDGGYQPCVDQGQIFYRYQSEEHRRRFRYTYTECLQGQFLRHVLPISLLQWTVISWWDRCQGDTRGACNSSFLMQGEHPSSAMLRELEASFPHVLTNLAHKGVELTEVFL